jgi:hypothetical protein
MIENPTIFFSWLGGGITAFVVLTLVIRHYFPPDTR